jgi:hypothetical protein
MAERRGRGRLNAFETLPPECDPLIAIAAADLQAREKLQKDIYKEFFDGCQRLMAESHGEISFAIPSPSAFNRYSINLAAMTRRLDETREIAGAIASTFDAGKSDDVTLIASEAIKTLVFQLLTTADPAKVDLKGVKVLADALRSAVQAQNISSIRKDRLERQFAEKTEQTVREVGKQQGWSEDSVDAALAKVLGVQVARK